jgi:hypothetical protein
MKILPQGYRELIGAPKWVMNTSTQPSLLKSPAATPMPYPREQTERLGDIREFQIARTVRIHRQIVAVEARRTEFVWHGTLVAGVTDCTVNVPSARPTQLERAGISSIRAVRYR